MASLVGDVRKGFRVVFVQGRLCRALKEGDIKRVAHHRSYVACIERVPKVDGCVQSSALSRPSCTASSYSTDCAKKLRASKCPMDLKGHLIVTAETEKADFSSYSSVIVGT